ncbi:MAG: hypothetical protein JWN04_911 [Myxococcaceae bacterium]|nr:hypothetical protein [Myxococcaceae bacterium]
MSQCIYCQRSEPAVAFAGREHVLPQSFGRFQPNLTLHESVCDECNKLFGATIDRELARGSIDGFDRYRLGRLPPSKYAHLGKAQKRIDQFVEGPFAGMRVTWKADEQGTLQAAPLPQLGFLQSGTNTRRWFLVDEVPTHAQRREQGLAGEDVSWTHPHDERATAELIRRLESDGTQVSSQTTPQETKLDSVRIELVETLGPQFYRVIAKIGLNYIASQFGRDVALRSCFDLIRRFVLHGEQLPEGWCDATAVAESGGKSGHMICAVWDADSESLWAVVSFHWQRVYRMRLSQGNLAAGDSMERCHFFDFDGMKVTRSFLA